MCLCRTVKSLKKKCRPIIAVSLRLTVSRSWCVEKVGPSPEIPDCMSHTLHPNYKYYVCTVVLTIGTILLSRKSTQGFTGNCSFPVENFLLVYV